MVKEIIISLGLCGLVGCTHSESMELQGRISMKGASVHTYLTIYDEKSHKSYKIQNKEAFNLLQRQNQTLRLEANLIKKASGPGFPAVIEVLEVK